MLATVLSIAPFAHCSIDKDRKVVANRLAEQIEHAKLRRIYVMDFLDPAGARTDRGCYFASVFSANLKKDLNGFEVLNRAEVQKLLDSAEVSFPLLQKPEVVPKIGAIVGADAILQATMAVKGGVISLDLSLRETSTGSSFYQTHYEEKVSASFEASFPASSDTLGHIFYFPGLDGLSTPKCLSCPQPSYTDGARKRKVSGSLIVSVHVTEQGAVDDVRVVDRLDPDLDRAALKIIRTWKLQPTKDSLGTAVPTRVPVEVTFHLY